MLIPACKRRSLPEVDGRCGGNGERLLPLAGSHCHNIGAPSAGPTQNSTRMPIPSLAQMHSDFRYSTHIASPGCQTAHGMIMDL